MKRGSRRSCRRSPMSEQDFSDATDHKTMMHTLHPTRGTFPPARFWLRLGTIDLID